MPFEMKIKVERFEVVGESGFKHFPVPAASLDAAITLRDELRKSTADDKDWRIMAEIVYP